MGKEEGGRNSFEEEERPFILFINRSSVREGRAEEQLFEARANDTMEMLIEGHIIPSDPALETLKGQCRARRCISKGLSRECPLEGHPCCRQW